MQKNNNQPELGRSKYAGCNSRQHSITRHRKPNVHHAETTTTYVSHHTRRLGRPRQYETVFRESTGYRRCRFQPNFPIR